jgi:hypothetical protein
MARFGQAFINQLTSPGYGQGLFNLGSAIGSAPAIAAAAERQKQQESQLMNYVSALGQNSLPPAGMAAQRESLLQSGISLDKILAAENVGAQQRERVIAGLEARQENINKETKEARRRQLEKNAVNLATTLGRPNDAAALVGADEATLRSYLMQKPGERKTSVMSAGSRLVDTATGEVISEAPFKPTEPKEATVNFQKRDDGSILVFSGTELVQTIEPPKAENDQYAAMSLITKSVYLQGEVDKLSKDIGFSEAGLPGQLLSNVGGRDAYDRDRDIINLKSYLGFEQINEMKRQAAQSGASGTGLGQISNIEFMSLQSTVDALDVGMSEEAQREALANIKKHLKVTQMLASGVAPKDTIDWNSETYKASGYHKDTVTGNVFYAPDGKNGQVYILQDGKFVKARVF